MADTSKGIVEYATAGTGPALLVIHGAYGGYDQGLLFGRDFADAGFGAIAPSRPGYLHTPLATGRTFPEAADAFAALLDTLGVARALVMTISGGGLTGLELCRRHPGRVAALVLACSIARRYVPNPDNTAAAWIDKLFYTSPGVWLMHFGARLAPRAAAEAMLRTMSDYGRDTRKAVAARIAADRRKRRFLLKLLQGFSPFSLRRDGLRNELDEAARYDENPDWSGIKTPTLIVHGKRDADVPFDTHAAYAARTIPHAETCFSETGFHLLPLCDDYPEMHNAMTAFLQRHAGSASRLPAEA
ncbi:MAG TPA: alpha/beta hydrolase [Burkholderiales bacterium]|nr:alpha/beta hydrolase [Burkholderiales bacterium]